MNFLYLYINLGSFLLPIIFSFHPKIKFYEVWRSVLPGILVSGLVYLSWDLIFTNLGYWGFNENYLIGLYIHLLPIEEILFFVCIPYACLFTHYSFLKMCPKWGLGSKLVNWFNYLLIIGISILVIFNMDKAYTMVNGCCFLAVLISTMVLKPEILRSFYPTFFVLLIPFLIVNGVLTGSYIENEVVWYNNVENLGVRLLTVPIEDFFYAFGMLLLALLIASYMGFKVRNQSERL